MVKVNIKSKTHRKALRELDHRLNHTIEIFQSFTLESSTCQVLQEQTLASKAMAAGLRHPSYELKDNVNKAMNRAEREDLGDKELKPKLYHLLIHQLRIWFLQFQQSLPGKKALK